MPFSPRNARETVICETPIFSAIVLCRTAMVVSFRNPCLTLPKRLWNCNKKISLWVGRIQDGRGEGEIQINKSHDQRYSLRLPRPAWRSSRNPDQTRRGPGPGAPTVKSPTSKRKGFRLRCRTPRWRADGHRSRYVASRYCQTRHSYPSSA